MRDEIFSAKAAAAGYYVLSSSGSTGLPFRVALARCFWHVKWTAKMRLRSSSSSRRVRQHVLNLAREAIAACLAPDIGLPVSKPWLVEFPQEIIPVVTDARTAGKLRRSCPIAFGATRIPVFPAWSTGQRLSDMMRPTASGILLFDAIIQTPDRRAANPNRLVQGNELRIIDRELAFMHRISLLCQAPWLLGGMKESKPLGCMFS
jgi:hypothetical protein